MSNVTRTATAVAAVFVVATVFASIATANDGHGKGREHHRRGAELRFAHEFTHRHHRDHHVVAPTTAGASLELRKVVVPAADSGRFNLIARYLRGALISRTADAGNGSSSGRFAIPTGHVLNIEETAGTNTSLSNYTSMVACQVVSGSDKGTVYPIVSGHAVQLTAKPGDGYTCTFTNARKTS